jgi:hypothetical protein
LQVFQQGYDVMTIGTVLLVVLIIALLGGFSGIGGGRFYGTGHYGGGGFGVALVIVLKSRSRRLVNSAQTSFRSALKLEIA